MPSNTNTRSRQNEKHLEGIRMTEELRALLEKSVTIVTVDDDEGDDDTIQATDHSETCASARATVPLPLEASRSLLQTVSKDTETLPMPVVRAMYSVLLHSKEKDNSVTKLDQVLASTSLVFTAPPAPSAETDGHKRFRQRMARLKLKAEETQYKKLTGNLDTSVEDDVTTKTMTYAASVGLNMIVAPISFGVFMYFFAGQVFAWVLPEVQLKPHQTDVRRVIAGVISGVIMLFIEMILFVIRTHELDASVRKKRRKNKGVSPFGHAK